MFVFRKYEHTNTLEHKLTLIEFLPVIMKAKNIWTMAFIIFLIILSASLIYGINERKKAELALKNSDTVVAIIIQKTPKRSYSEISVKFTYHGMQMQSEFAAEPDTFEVSDRVLLKISKAYPKRYVEVIKKVH